LEEYKPLFSPTKSIEYMAAKSLLSVLIENFFILLALAKGGRKLEAATA